MFALGSEEWRSSTSQFATSGLDLCLNHCLPACLLVQKAEDVLFAGHLESLSIITMNTKCGNKKGEFPMR